MQIKRARADIEVFDLKTAYLGRSPTCSYARRMSRWSRRLAAATYTVRRAQRTHGTTDPGGVWHAVHRRECLTILLGTYAENGQIIGTSTNCIVFGTPACLCLCIASPVPTDWCLQSMQSTTPVQVWVHWSK